MAKELMQNRRRLGLGDKWRILRLVVRENGLRWTFWFGLYYLSSQLAEFAHGRMTRLRQTLGLPGLNSPAINRLVWDAWDWAAQGDEWTVSEDWKRSLVAQVMVRHIPEDSDILEIGPGSGRWTDYLLARARHLTGVDISQACVDACRKRFADRDNVTFQITDGTRLAFTPDASIDAIWSFDVFVHINAGDAERYVEEFVRVLRPGGVAVIHHGGVAGERGGWRSDLTASAFAEALARHGLPVVEQFDSWTDAGMRYEIGPYGDFITVFKKPV